MDIEWHGFSCFTIKGKNGTVVTDPYDAKVSGGKTLKLDADIVLANANFDRHHALGGLEKTAKVFDWPGEYEAKGIIVQGIAAFDRPREKEEGKEDAANRAIIFAIEVDGFKICHLSNLGHKLTPEMLEQIGNVDVLLLPVGGEGCLDAKKAHEVMEQLDPRVVIPMYYSDVAPFLKEVGLHAPVREKIWKIQSPANLPQEQTEFKVLESVG